MFSPAEHSLPRSSLFQFVADMVRRRRIMYQNDIDLQAMPEVLQRDLGIHDGRVKRGEPGLEGALCTARLIYLQRSL